MKRRALLLVLTCVVLVLGMASAATADTVYVGFWSPSEISIGTSDDIVLANGWGGPRGSVMSWRQTSYHVATIEEVGGSVVFSVDRKESKDYMEELQPSGTVDWAFNPHIKMPAFVCFWSCPVGCLPAGDYELVLVVGLDHVATDLGDWDGDGKPDVWGGFWPEGFYVEAHITIHVTP